MEQLLQKLERDPGSHKGDNGRVGIIGGSADYTGAPALSAMAALKTGCDLATILTSESSRDIVAGFSENFIVRSYEADYFGMGAVEKALELDEEVDSIVIGPGLGDPEPKAVREFLQECESPVVVDADALEHAPRSPIQNAVLTPHSGEFEKHVEGSLEALLERDNVVVRKGSTDTVYTGSGKTDIDAGHPTMTVGGTGDVLAGFIASLLAQGLDREEAAKLGAWINGKAGEKAAEKYGNGALATDMVEEVPVVLGGQG